jgi:hypothetical protein
MSRLSSRLSSRVTRLERFFSLPPPQTLFSSHTHRLLCNRWIVEQLGGVRGGAG